MSTSAGSRTKTIDLDKLVGTSDMKKVNGSQGQTAASLGKSLERGHDSGPEPGPEAHRIWPFLIMFPYFYLQNGQSLL